MPRASRSTASSGSSTASTAYPIYTTYTEEELQQAFAKLSHIGTNGGSTGNHAYLAKNGSASRGGRGSRLIKSHECSVSFPDGTMGLCKYTRGGPAWHVFAFEQAGIDYKALLPFPSAWRSVRLPTRNCTERMDNTIAAIEAKAVELANVAFAEAVARESRDRFKRAVSPTHYNRYGVDNPATRTPSAQMSVKRAKEMAGKYALCLRIGSGDSFRFIPCTGVNNSDVFESLDEANAAWKDSIHRSRRFVACLCRYSRQWELPVYNPLYGDTAYAELLGLNPQAVTIPVDATNTSTASEPEKGVVAFA